MQVGDQVTVIAQPPYVKTADPMPMLRPGALAPAGSRGQLLEQRAKGYWVVRLATGVFLIDERYLALG
ncbi:MAG: DUF3148 domain-containing protein [Thermostichales cyanobacterium DRC_bins_46]